jgi:hypothetical protein
MLPLLSARATDVLMKFAGPDIQVLSAEIDVQGRKHAGHRVVNILRSVQAIDHSRSKYLCVPGTTRPMRFERLRLRSGCLAGYHLARNAEYRPQILVSAALREALLESGLVGFAFQLPSQLWP